MNNLLRSPHSKTPFRFGSLPHTLSCDPPFQVTLNFSHPVDPQSTRAHIRVVFSPKIVLTLPLLLPPNPEFSNLVRLTASFEAISTLPATNIKVADVVSGNVGSIQVVVTAARGTNLVSLEASPLTFSSGSSHAKLYPLSMHPKFRNSQSMAHQPQFSSGDWTYE